MHLAIIGGGPAGYVAALHASDRGARVTLVGGDDLGGTCLWRGCIPTKSLVASARLLSRVREGGRFGLIGDMTPAADWPAMRDRAGRIATSHTRGIAALLQDRGVQVIPGHAQFVSSDRMITREGELEADRFLLCTGSKPMIPAGFTVDGTRIASSDDLLRWETLPQSILIVGGGVIACEFAFILAALGITVTVVERLDSPLPGEEPELRATLLREMKKRRIRFVGGMAIERLTADTAGVACHVDGRVAERAERALIAVGRTPNTASLRPEIASLQCGSRGELVVDQHQRTNVKNVYAAGDVTGGLMLAHHASYQARIAVNHMLGLTPDSVAAHAIPRATFTDPEIAGVGLTEQAARTERGDAVRVGRFDLRTLGMAHAMNELSGLVKVVVDSESDRVLGVHIAGAHAAEMINEAAVIVNGRIAASALAHSVHAHPSLSEAIVEAVEAALHGHSTHQLVPKTHPGDSAHVG